MAEQNAAFEKILIVGDGFQPYLIALSLRRHVGLAAKITVIETGCSSAPPAMLFSGQCLRNLHAEIGIDESEFQQATQAHPLLATRLKGFNLDAKGERKGGFFYCDSEYGFFCRGKRFNKLFYQFCKRCPDVRLDDFCLQAATARNEKFTLGSTDPGSLLSTINYNYAVDAETYRQFLEGRFDRLNIQVVKNNSIAIDSNEHEILCVRAGSDATISADLYIDCSTDGLISQKIFPDKVSLVRCLPSLSASSVQASASEPVPYVDMNVNEQFITKTYRLKNHVVTDLWRVDENKPSAAREVQWIGNCISMGKNSLCLQASLADDLQSLCADIHRLKIFWPDRSTLVACRDAYNREGALENWQMVDVANLLFASVFRSLNFTENNQRRINLFRNVGRLPVFEREALSHEQWIVLLHALGYQELAVEEDMSHDDVWIHAELSEMLKTFNRIIGSMSSYGEFLNRHFEMGN